MTATDFRRVSAYRRRWSATLDGRPVPILRADYAFQAVPVPAGRHALRLEYHNRWLGRGAAVSLATLGLLLGALAVRRRRASALSGGAPAR